ncbi:MAG: RNA-binding protein [Planctomycetales bacterium 4484_113]|nr:MAG: RNA-binding protein [Planctomycetales bacterium 4484_113]
METNKLYVGNLNYDTTEDALREAFTPHGTVVSVTIIGRKGFGFVEMDSTEAAQKAKDALDGTVLDGRTIRVDAARPRRESSSEGGDSF